MADRKSPAQKLKSSIVENQIRIADIVATKNPEWMQVVFTTVVEDGGLMGIIARKEFKVATAYEPVSTAIAATMVVGTVYDGYRVVKLSSDKPYYSTQERYDKTGLFHKSVVEAV